MNHRNLLIRASAIAIASVAAVSGASAFAAAADQDRAISRETGDDADQSATTAQKTPPKSREDEKKKTEEKKAEEKAREAEAKAKVGEETQDEERPGADPVTRLGNDDASVAGVREQDNITNVIVVSGVRNSLAVARSTKRESEAILDSVEADDIGKLPNNTVGDVIASIPGINVFRREGEVDNIQLRGLGGVQTTIGGTPIASGADRVASIADLPADLVKSVQVYKTRTPDQVEGAGGGTINIEFRTPADFKPGLSFSGNVQGRYNDQARKVNQTYTGIFNYRHDTDIGSFGIQLGATVNYNPFLESQARNDPLGAVQTRQVVGPQVLPLPTFAPNQVFYAYTTGSRTTPSLNGAIEWATEENSIVLEGNYARPRFDRFNNILFVPITLQATSTNALPALSNIVLVPGTNRIASVTVSPVNQIGPIAELYEDDSDNYLAKLSVRHNEARFDLTGEIALTGGSFERQSIVTRNRFVNRPTYDVEFATDKYAFPQLDLQFRDLDLLDPEQYRFFGVFEGAFRGSNSNLFARADLTLRTFDDFIDYLKFGVRYTRSTLQRRSGLREIRNLEISPEDMPEGYDALVPIAKGFGGTKVENNARWLSYDRFAARENYDGLREFVSQFDPAFEAPDVPEDIALNYDGTEQTWAGYATVHYKVDPLIPIEGIVGARVTNWLGENQSYNNRNVLTVVDGLTTFVREIFPQNGRGNYVTVEPTATAILKFTSNLQLRLSYNVGIRRPSLGDISPYINLNDADLRGRAGNPSLRPEKTIRYDAILEYYFNRVGVATINPFYWKLDGSFARFDLPEEVPGGLPGELYLINRPYNAGQGYRRGVEAQIQTFFTFLPGILKNFGVVLNYTYTESEQTFNGLPGSDTAESETIPVFGVAKHVGNITGLFERGSLNARLSYNYNGTQLDQQYNPIRNSSYIIPRQWMDAAINYTITKGPLENLGFSVQIQNVLASTRRSFYGYPDQPRDVIYMARTYGGTIRYRF